MADDKPMDINVQPGNASSESESNVGPDTNAPSIQHDSNPTHTDVEKWMNEKREVTLVVAGKSGVGKSSLINTVLGLSGSEAAVAKHNGKSTTQLVRKYACKIRNSTIHMIDTLGLSSLDVDERNVLESLQSKTQRMADLLLYCTSLQKSCRIDKGDVAIVKLLTEAFGRDIWKRAILILKFADEFMPEEEVDKPGFILLGELMQQYAEQFQMILQKNKIEIQVLSSLSTAPKDSSGIVAVPAGLDRGIQIQGGRDWYNYMMWEILSKCSDESLPHLMLLVNPEFRTVFRKTAAGAAGGAFVGAGIGAAIGGILFGVPTLGIGAPLGFGVGAGGGALIGMASSATLTSLTVTRIVPALKRWKVEKERKQKQSNKCSELAGQAAGTDHED